MKINEKIRQMRESKDWTQTEMAEKLNMSVAGYQKIEQGKSKADDKKLERFVKLFDMNLFELLAVGEKQVLLIADNSNNGCNVIGSSSEIGFEIQKLCYQNSLFQ